MGVLQETYLLPQFYRQNKFDDFISFTMTRRTASHTVFSNYWIINIWEANEIFFLQKITFFAYFFCVACFYWKEIKYLKKKRYVTVSATQFPTKWCPFQPPRSKTVGGETFGVAKSLLFEKCTFRQTSNSNSNAFY